MIENPFLRFRDRQRFGQQVVHFHYFNAAIAQLLHEIEVVALGGFHPHHIIEKQPITIGWRKTRVRTSGRADHHQAQLADFRMHAEFGGILTHSENPSPVLVGRLMLCAYLVTAGIAQRPATCSTAVGVSASSFSITMSVVMPSASPSKFKIMRCRIAGMATAFTSSNAT